MMLLSGAKEVATKNKQKQTTLPQTNKQPHTHKQTKTKKSPHNTNTGKTGKTHGEIPSMLGPTEMHGNVSYERLVDITIIELALNSLFFSFSPLQEHGL